MTLRRRLIVAFLLMSVVPLTAVTLYSYNSSLRAFHRAAEVEAGQAAAEMGRRMEIVTADVGRRVEQLQDLAVTADAVEPTTGAGEGPMRERLKQQIVPMLGDAAALLDELVFEPSVPAHPASPTPPVPPVPPVPPAKNGPHPAAPAVPPSPATIPKIVLDLPSIIAEATRSAPAAKDGDPDLKSKLGAALEARIEASVENAMRAAGEATKNAVTRERSARESERRAQEVENTHEAIQRKRFDVPVRRGGEVLGNVSASLNLDRTLSAVLSSSAHEEGEIPFAIDAQGQLHTPKPSNVATLKSLGITDSRRKGGTQRSGDWVVVTRKDPSGVTFGLARQVGRSLRDIRQASIRNLFLGLLVIGLAAMGIVPVSGRMTRNLSSLTDGVRSIARGEFETRVPVKSPDEFGQLAQAFNQMAADLEQRQQLLVERERMRRELELSRQIQTEMLPSRSLRLGLTEVKGISIPAREVGGDFFNYFPLSNGQIALLVGDVSGKGVSAALLMANIQATLRARVPLEPDLAKLADAIDRDTDERTPHAVYVTLFVGVLDPAARTLRYVNAGHNPQFVLRAAGGLERLSSTGMPIGLMAGHGYTEKTIALGDDDLIFFYTDGMVETENEAGEMFDAERLEALLLREHAHGIEVVLERVEAAVTAFRGKAEPFDDATMMAVRLSPSRE